MKIRLYYSQSKPQMPVALKTYAQHVVDLLDEYRQASKGKIEVERLDPEPDSDEESSAGMDGVQGEMTPDGEKLYTSACRHQPVGRREAFRFPSCRPSASGCWSMTSRGRLRGCRSPSARSSA